ncbi:hypothetical protein CPB85DRAFT_562742 [Mucidula mucida]|nr:hypothetical protein CPB85DRAFT_562742 [Mucidula mucida]
MEETRNRISAFWQVFIVDRCWTIANGLPLALPDGDSNHARIKTPWPMPLPQDNVEPSKYIPALRAKAVALLERSGRLSSNAIKDDDYWGQHSTAVIALKRLSSSLPMFVGFEPWRIQAPFIDADLFAIHTAANVTVIHLYKDINEEETTKAMRTVLSLIRQLSDADYEFLDPTLSAAWTCVAKAYMRTISLAAEAPGGPAAYSNVIAVAEGELDVICNAMRVMSAFFPIAGEHAKKVEQERQRIRR